MFGGLTIYTYGFLVATGFFAGIAWIVYDTNRLKLETAKVVDLVFYLIIAAILGSRIVFLIVNDPMRLLKQPWSMFMVWEGGLVFFGGLIGAVVASLYYFKRKKMSFLLYADIFSPGIAIGHVFGRFGCLMAGCCHGRLSGEHWYSIVFPNVPTTFAPVGVHLYPTQIIEMSGEFLIFLVLVLFRKHKKFDGQVFAFYLILYSILRFLNEMLRGDVDRGYIIKNVISTSQGVSLLLFTIGISLLVWGYKKTRSKHV